MPCVRTTRYHVGMVFETSGAINVEGLQVWEVWIPVHLSNNFPQKKRLPRKSYKQKDGVEPFGVVVKRVVIVTAIFLVVTLPR